MPSLARRVLFCLAVALLPSRLAAQRAVADSGGDFRVGDRVFLMVEGEPQLTDSFTVVPGPALQLPVIGRVSLAGVRYADLQAYMSETIGRYVRNAAVTARVTLRIGVLGEVQRPGFYPLPVLDLVSDAFMAAGGPTADARLDHAQVERDGSTAISADSLTRGLTAGITLAQLGFRSGDQIVVPGNSDWLRYAQIIGILLGAAVTVLGLARIR
jgi:polysaccharide biosynthesis/export protein